MLVFLWLSLGVVIHFSLLQVYTYCHEILLGVGPLESHGSQRLLLYGETLLLRSHERSYKDSRERNIHVLDSVFDG